MPDKWILAALALIASYALNFWLAGRYWRRKAAGYRALWLEEVRRNVTRKVARRTILRAPARKAGA